MTSGDSGLTAEIRAIVNTDDLLRYSEMPHSDGGGSADEARCMT